MAKLDEIRIKGQVYETGLAMEQTSQDIAAILTQHLHDGSDGRSVNCIKVGGHWYYFTDRVVKAIDDPQKYMIVWVCYDATSADKYVYSLALDVKEGDLVSYDGATSVSIPILETSNDQLAKQGEYNDVLGEIKAAIAAIKVGMVIVQQTTTSGLTLESGTTSVWASAISSLSFDLLMPSNGTEAHYRLRFVVSGSAFQISSPIIEWGGDEPTWTDGKKYEMDIVSDGVTNYAIAKEW